MDTLRALVIFMSTADNGSFSDAARKLGVSPAAVSQSIARLEQELDVRLFNRTTRQVTLTEDGRRFYEQCRSPVKQLDVAINRLKESGEELTGQLRISLPNAFGRRFVLPLVREFCELYPKITLFFGMGDHFSDLIEDGYDIGVRIGMLTDSRMAARVLAAIPQYVVATPEYWQKHGKPENIRELQSHDCINYQFPTSGRISKWEFEQKGERMPVEVSGTLIVNEIEGVTALALQGLGVAYLPGFEAITYIRSGQLEPVLTDMVSHQFSVTTCFPNREHLAPRTSAFVDFIVNKLATHPDILANLPDKYLNHSKK